jgi:ABC-type multidrug transport system fused ATPase/permease subunit
MTLDRIVVMSEGRVEEIGSHSELLAKDSSLYKRLWQLQAGGFLKS